MPMPANGTTLDLSYNNFLGPIRDAWSSRSAGWKSIAVVGNPQMCGALPPWFLTKFVPGGNTTLISQICAGGW